MNIKKGQVLELEVSDIAFGGKGLAKVDGFAVFVDKAVSGDIVKARISKKKKNFAEAQILEFIKKSPLRHDAKCDYSGNCGGCKWQFLDYEKQLEYKTAHVAESIEHIGLLKGVTVHPALPSPNVFGYRNKMEFSCSDKRWLLPHELNDESIEKGMGIGLHVPGTYFKVLDIDKCWIFPDTGSQILGDVRQYVKKSGVPVYGLHSHVGFWRFVMLRHSYATDTWMLNLITSSENMEVVKPLAEELMKKYPQITSIVNNITAKKAGVAVGDYEVLLMGEPFIKDRLGDYQFKISANSFFQTNTPGAEKLYEMVSKYAGLTGNEVVVDLYSGTGTIPIWLSSYAKEVTGIEIVESSVADAKSNCIDNGVDNCNFILGDIKAVLPTLPVKPDVMVVDPPRAGMHEDVIKSVLALAPKRIVYVSCNPATLARDILKLKEKYHIAEVQPVDMFPHTYHIESVARLELIDAQTVNADNTN